MTEAQADRSAAGVSDAAEAALRAAMERLFAGRPRRTDGRLTKQNLWKEADVSRATMNRARTVLAEWDAHISEHGKSTPAEARLNDEAGQLKQRLAAKTAECTALERRLRAAATAIAALHHDNQALRAELDAHAQSTVIDLAQRRRSSTRTE
jgi:hypothetical protein